MAVATNENIRLQHILHPDLKQFNTFDQKDVSRIRFSSGGQYLSAIRETNIIVFSTYSLEMIRYLTIPPLTNKEGQSTIHFNFNDSRLCFMSTEG